MRVGLVECKNCRFWVRYNKEELEFKPGLLDIGLCYHFRSASWLFRMQSDGSCDHGELQRRNHEPRSSSSPSPNTLTPSSITPVPPATPSPA